tara:strand:+ start:348 stop:716 length:369 start_codon:yes stop_codon:yes gene_type:complete
MKKKEVISYDGGSMGPPYSVQLLENCEALILNGGAHYKIKIEERKILTFWKNIEILGVWNWRKKYPYIKPKYEPMLDGYSWELKLRDRNGRAKYCTGYESFPRNFKKLIYELDDLFDSEIDF